MPKPPIKDVLAVARQGARSAIYEWLWSDYDELRPGLNISGVNWAGIANLAKNHGIKAGKGLDPTAEIVRQTWARVRRDKQATAPKQPKNRPSPVMQPVVPPATDDDGPRHTFRPAKPRKVRDDE